MNRTATVALAFLLVSSSPALALAANTTPHNTDIESVSTDSVTQSTSTQFISMLTVDEDQQTRTGSVEPSVDVGNVLDMQHTSLEANLDTNTLDERVTAAETDEQRRTALEEHTTRLEREVKNLSKADQRTRAAYASGDISSEEYVRRLADISTRANNLKTTVAQIRLYASEDNDELNARTTKLETGLLEFDGPVRNRLVEINRGDTSPTRVSVKMNDRGIILSMVEDGTYIREAYRADRRTSVEATDVPNEEIWSLTSNLYPSYSARYTDLSASISAAKPANMVRMYFEHPYGNVTTYAEITTANVYHETLRYDLEKTPVTDKTSRTQNGMTIQVNQTHVGGPMQVSLFDAKTGEPIDNAVVLVNGMSVGYTDDNGELWVVAPYEEFEVSATSGLSSVRVSVNAAEAER